MTKNLQTGIKSSLQIICVYIHITSLCDTHALSNIGGNVKFIWSIAI